MHKSVKCLLLLFSLTIALVLPPSAAGQAKIRLEKAKDKKTSESKVSAPSRIAKPRGQAELHSPIVLVQPSARSSNDTTGSAKQQTAEAQEQSALTECDWSLLLLNEVGAYYLIITNTGCINCNLGSELSQSTPGILGFSHSPSGPWTETLTVYTQLNTSGSGVSDYFYIKGQAIGLSTFYGNNFWSSFAVDFQVVPCSCPQIPIVP
jgi:hypothetical protein